MVSSSCFRLCPFCVILSILCLGCIKAKKETGHKTQHSVQVFGVKTTPLLLFENILREAGRRNREMGVFWSTKKTYQSPV